MNALLPSIGTCQDHLSPEAFDALHVLPRLVVIYSGLPKLQMQNLMKDLMREIPVDEA